MASPLEPLTGPGKPLHKEPPDAKEFSGLKRSALARLSDSGKTSNSLKSRFNLAYNAAHATRFSRDFSHFWVESWSCEEGDSQRRSTQLEKNN